MDKLGIAKRAFRRVTARRKPAVLLVLLVFAFVLSYGLFAQKSHSIEQKNVKPDFNWNVSNKLDEQVKLDVLESEDTNSISKNLLEQSFLEDTEGRKPHDIKNEKNEKNIDESDMKQETTCLLNAGGIRRYTYDRVFGDKETFWLGMEMAQEEYTFNGHYPGNLGVSKKVGGEYQVCGRQILHFDENDSPVWFNGGIQELKDDRNSPVIRMEDYWEETGSWELFEENVACLKADQPPLKFNDEFKSVISQSEQIAIELGLQPHSN
ncbi:hypothetical protein BC833DRAFT_567220 [Globomyces pollinis-pini]|nr:hypothetical protein BC833DRAFT_567220 [Globomyces pollinis-pini]